MSTTLNSIEPKKRMSQRIDAKRVLLISYAFPPVGGAGVQRATKFTKYLGQFGWQPTVLTVANPSVPVLDRSLEADLPADVSVVRARSWEPGYRFKKQAAGAQERGGQSGRITIKQRLMRVASRVASTVSQPDPQVLWHPGAVSAGKKLLRSEKFDAIFVTAPPFSSLLVGAALARYSRLPLVVDYRDEWTLSNKYWENKNLGPISNWVQSRMERRVLRTASAVLATTRSSAEALRAHCAAAGSKATVSWIYNGYDSDDFAHRTVMPRDNSRLRLVYTGTLWNLTSVSPLVTAVHQLAAESPDLASRLDLVFVGRRTDAEKAHLELLNGLPCRLITHDYLDHSAALDEMCGADANILLLSDVPGAGRVVPAKLFEYMASRRPILALAPLGESWQLLDQYPRAYRFNPADADGIVDWLVMAIKNSAAFKAMANDDEERESQFDRRFQAGQLADILNRCCGKPAVPDNSSEQVLAEEVSAPV
jgi:glycosyltransferase involved in cell wall biosynthesis